MVVAARASFRAAARLKEVRGTDRVSVRDSDAIGNADRRAMGARDLEAWQERLGATRGARYHPDVIESA